jgi:hypothetical protein
MKNLMGIIKRESINSIFILGNLVHMQPEIAASREIMSKALRAFECLPIPVYIMGGEKNSELLWDMKYNKPGSNVQVVHDRIIRLEPLDPGRPEEGICLAHCLGGVAAGGEVEAYVLGVKKALKGCVGDGDFLLVGNCQHYVLNTQARIGSMKDFSPDNRHTGYAIVAFGPEGRDIRIVGK